jgi:hypothetical protein
MTIKQFSRFVLIAALLALTMTVIQAQQTPLPVPIPADRGVQTNIAPFYVPEEYASRIRGGNYTVTTTVDENGGCNDGGTGLSLREVLVYCVQVGGSNTVFLPAGDYVLDSTINTADKNIALIGENPETTRILANGLNNMMIIVLADHALSIMNITFTNQGTASTVGGALIVGGYGSFVANNTLFEGNYADNGGALYLATGNDPLHATINYSAFGYNGASTDGAAIFFDGSPSSGSHLWVQNSVFVGNTSGYVSCTHGGSAISALFNQPDGDSVTIESSAFYENAISSGTTCGGAVAVANPNGPVSLNVSYSEFVSNTVPTARGGAVYAASNKGTHNISNAFFADNSADFGGAIYDASSAMVNIDESQFYANVAFDSGGALYLPGGNSLNITFSDFSDNVALSDGGAAYIAAEPAFIAYTAITSNFAGLGDGLGGQGGGLYVLDHGATLHNMFLEDNAAEFGPDCFSYADPGPGDWVTSLGGVSITDTDGCMFAAHEDDMFDNLLQNGGFEIPASGNLFPASWTPKNITGDKLNCNGQTPFGYCALMLKGSAAENATFVQNVDLSGLLFNPGDTLKLYAVGRGGALSNVKLIAKVVYSTPGQAASTAKITFNGTTGGAFVEKSAELTVQDSAISKIQVKIVNRSASGKFYLDRVYLFEPDGGPVTPRAALPAPAAPSGFRGDN